MNPKHDQWRAGTITVLLHLRLLAIRHGHSALAIWERLGERVRLANRQAESVEHWCSTLIRKLGVVNTHPEAARAMIELQIAVHDETGAWLQMLDDEHGFIMAAARDRFDAEKAGRKAETEGKVRAANELLESVGAAKPTRSRSKKTAKAEPITEPTQTEFKDPP